MQRKKESDSNGITLKTSIKNIFKEGDFEVKLSKDSKEFIDEKLNKMCVDIITGVVDKVSNKFYTSDDIEAVLKEKLPSAIVSDIISAANKAQSNYEKSKESGRGEQKADISMSVNRVKKIMQSVSEEKKPKPLAAVYMAGALDELCFKILEAANNETVENSKKTIKPSDVELGILHSMVDAGFMF